MAVDERRRLTDDAAVCDSMCRKRKTLAQDVERLQKGIDASPFTREQFLDKYVSLACLTCRY